MIQQQAPKKFQFDMNVALTIQNEQLEIIDFPKEAFDSEPIKDILLCTQKSCSSMNADSFTNNREQETSAIENICDFTIKDNYSKPLLKHEDEKSEIG